MEEDGFPLLDELLVHESALLIQEEEALDCWGRPAPCNASSLGGWKAAMFLLGANSLQSLAISGCTVNLVVFLVRVLQKDNASAANAITNWIGTTFISSLIGGSLGDAYMGRLWTSISYQMLYVAGLILFALSGSMIAQQVTEPCMGVPNCEPTPPSSAQVSLFYTALYMMGLGTASLIPNVVSLGADQFDSPKQKSTFITLYMASSNVGMLLSTSVIAYMENEGQWVLGFWISAGAGILGFLFFLAGMPSSRQFSPGKNPLLIIAHVMLAAARNQEANIPPDNLLMDIDPRHKTPRDGIQRTHSLRWLDKAAGTGTTERENVGHEWSRICTVERVEEVKSVCRLMPFWMCGILVSSVTAQKGTLFVLQGATMDNRVVGTLEFPSSSMGLFSLTTVVLGAPLYSWVVAPWMLRHREHKKEVSSIERMGAGLVMAIASISVAAIVESQRLRMAHEREDEDARFGEGKGAREGAAAMSMFWLIPQYVLEGLTVVFFACGHLDFNYSYAPPAMRSLATAITLSGFALGNYLSSSIVQIVTSATTWIPANLDEGHVDHFYWLLDALLLLTLALFVAASKWHATQPLPPPTQDVNSFCVD